jgi:putative ATPase
MGKSTPLAVELRPSKLKDIIGQEHLTDDGKPLSKMALKNTVRSTILWGPTGIGKTSIVRSLANEIDAVFCQLNATKATVSDLRSMISSARNNDKATIVFVDEIHRWNKSQQDTMLPVVEDGTIILFGATTENPKFAVNSTLLSRCLVFELKPLQTPSLIKIIMKVKEHYKNKGRKIDIDKEAAKILILRSSGDARKLITALETAIEILSDDDHITADHINLAIPDKHLVFDASGNEHYDLAHCYQESIQNSDVNAAIYWLAKWIESGEDPAYICRRMLITAFEDCASNPLAGPIAMAASYTTERTGLPECVIPMALATCEMASSKRDKTAYNAIMAAIDDVRNGLTIHVPPSLRAGTSGYFAAINKQYVEPR